MESQTIRLRPPVWALLSAVLIGGVFYIAGKNIEAASKAPSTITVSADAKTSAVPDIAEMNFGVTTLRQSNARVAIDLLKTRMNAVIDAVERQGVADKDITTEQFSLQPVFDYTTNGQIPRGYEATQILRLKVRRLETIGDVLQAATTAGANQIDSLQFRIDDPQSLQDQVRSEAIAKAKEKADKLSSSLGVILGRLSSYSEGSIAYPRQPMYMSMGAEAKSADSAGPTLPAGEQEVSVQVSLTYEVR